MVLANSLLALHLRAAHFRGHHGSALCGRRSQGHHARELLLKLDSLNVLLVFNLLLDVLVSLEQLVVLSFSQLESLVEVGLEFLLQSIHLVLLLLNQLSLSSDDLLLSLLHVLLSFLDLKLLSLLLDLVSLGVLLLLG